MKSVPLSGAASSPKRLLRYAGAVVIVLAAVVIADLFSRITGTTRLTSVFLSSVLLVAFYLGAGPGYVAAALALLAHLYLVDPPYQLSIGSFDELNALVLFIAASLLTCLLAGRMRDQADGARLRARATASLLDATRELSAVADEEFIRQALVRRLALMAGGDAVLRHGQALHAAPGQDVDADVARMAAGAERDAEDGMAKLDGEAGWTFRALRAGQELFGVAGWRTARGGALSPDESAALDLLADTAATAIARARLAAAKAEAESRARTEDLRNAILSSVSHDLRTPLATIMGSAGTLRRFADEFDVPTRRDLAAGIEEEAARLDSFVSNLLQMTRLQSGAVPLKLFAFGVAEMLHETVGGRPAGRERFSIEVQPRLPDALGDPLLFQQALANVFDNALRYAPGAEPIRVSASHQDSHILVEVADRGPGVPAEDLDRIFQKFVRSSSGDRISGTGLGLAITRGLMEAMGGSANAWPAPGGGLVVRLRIPSVPS